MYIVYLYIYMYICICIYVYLYTYTFIYMYVYKYLFDSFHLKPNGSKVFSSDFLLLLVEKLKITCSANLRKILKTKCCGFCRFILDWSNADDESLSSGSLNEHAISITRLKQIWNQTRNASFWDIPLRFVENFFFSKEEPTKIKNLDPSGLWKVSYMNMWKLPHMNIYIYIYIDQYKYTHIYIYMNICICIYTYTYI